MYFSCLIIKYTDGRCCRIRGIQLKHNVNRCGCGRAGAEFGLKYIAEDTTYDVFALRV